MVCLCDDAGFPAEQQPQLVGGAVLLAFLLVLGNLLSAQCF